MIDSAVVILLVITTSLLQSLYRILSPSIRGLPPLTFILRTVFTVKEVLLYDPNIKEGYRLGSS